MGTGPIVDNNLFFGEIYDARLESRGLGSPGFYDSNWKNSEIVRSPEGKIGAQMSPPDRVTGTIKPVSISNPRRCL